MRGARERCGGATSAAAVATSAAVVAIFIRDRILPQIDALGGPKAVAAMENESSELLSITNAR